MLTMPLRASLAEARRFAEAEEGWLRRQIARVSPSVEVGPGTRLPFAGGELEIAVGAGRIRRIGTTLAVAGPEFGAGVAAFLREAARARLAEAVERHAGRLGRKPGRLTLRDPRSRWGSCTATGDLMFSWRLVMAPPAVLDYVAAHEVAHLVELNHGPRFWAIVLRLAPQHASARAWLRQNGAGLHAYRFRGPT